MITKFDEQSKSAQLSDTEEEITGKVKEQTCQFVREACAGVDISPDDVLPVSGRWAYHARMLAMTPPKHPNNNRCRANVKTCLRDVQGQPCGEGEKLSTSLDVLSDDVLIAKLEEASGITTLEARYSQVYYRERERERERESLPVTGPSHDLFVVPLLPLSCFSLSDQ